ncbi:MAG: hypothetical protein R6W93_15200 [Candidatus Limnocylindrales bacterium]
MALLERTAPLSCSPLPAAEVEQDAGVVAAVTCLPPDAPAVRVLIQVFADSTELGAEWRSRIEAAAPPLDESEEACRDGRPGTRKWGFGDIACLVDDGVAEAWWTDRRTQTLGRIEGASDDVTTVYEWWRTTARPLGRTEGEEAAPPARPDASEGPTISDPPALVRVPGPPRAISCDATGESIPDEWGRAWRIKNIDLLERGGYERVVVNLVRTGRNRTDQPTQAGIERMPRSRVATAVPGAPRPRRGRTAIVVRLDGVREGPDLRGYRPSGTDLARELSVVRDDRGRVVIISVPPGTCYQLRIPVWGDSASGEEARAEVYIDLKER